MPRGLAFLLSAVLLWQLLRAGGVGLGVARLALV